MSLIKDFVAGRTPPDLYETYLAEGLFMPWADELIDASQPAGNCLDIACGTGVVSRKLSDQRQVSRIMSIDVAPPMIEKAQALQSENGLAPKAEFQVASALDLPFEDDCFDAAFCQQGLQFFPDKVAALNEAARVLKPDGEMHFAVWTSANDGNPVFGAFEEVVAQHLGADLLPFGPFSFGDRSALEATLDAADIKVSSLERRDLTVTLPDARSMVLFDLMFLGRPDQDGALQPVIDPEDEGGDAVIEQMIQELADATSQFAGKDGGLTALSSAHLVVAQKS